MYIGLSSEDETAGSATNQDGIFLKPRFASSGRDWRFIDTDGSSPNAGGAGDLINDEDPAISTDYFCELKRTSATTFEATVFTDSSYSVVRFKGRNTTLASVADLRYIKILNSNFTDIGNMTGTITDVQFFNNTEGLVDAFVLHGDEDLKPFEEFIPPGATKFFDFSNDTGWVFQGGVNISGGTLNGWGNEGGTIRRGIYDLFVNDSFKMNDTKWTVDVDYIFTAGSIPAHIPFAFADSSIVMFPPLGTIFQGDTTRGPGLFNLQIVTTNTLNQSVSNPLGQGIAVFLNIQYFLRFERLSVSRLKLSVFSDSARKIHITGSPIQLEPLVNALTNMFFIHSANAPQGGNPRTLTGRIDNLAIFNGVSSENDLVVNDDFSTYGTPVSPDFTDPFDDATGWTTTDSTRVRIEDDQGFLFYMAVRDGSNDQIAFDLGATVNPGPNIIDDDRWLLSFKFTVTDLITPPTGDNLVCFVSLRSVNQNTGTESSSDALVFETVATVGGALLLRIRAMNNQAYPAGSSTEFTTPLATGTLYVQLVRVSGTLLEGRLYSDENYTELIETVTLTISSGITSLRFLGVANLNSGTAPTGEFDVTIDDFQFWDGRSTTCDPVATFSDDFTYATQPEADAVWTIVGTGIEITAPSTVMDFDAQPDSTNVLSYHDLGVLPDAFRLRFKIDFTTATALQPTSALVGIGLSDANTARSVAQDMIDVELSVNNSTNNIIRFHSMVNSFPGGGTTIFQPTLLVTTGLIRFIELIRLNATQGIFTIYTDSSYTTVEETSGTINLGGSPSNLRFLKIYRPDNFTNTNIEIGEIDDIEVVSSGNPNWISTNEDIFVDPCQENIVFKNMVVQNDPKNITLDLGSALSNEKFVVRWSMVFGELVIGVASNIFIGMSDEDQNSESGDFQAYIMARIQNSISGETLGGISDPNNGPVGEPLDDPQNITWETNRKYFFEIVRDSNTTYKVSVFDDASYTFPLTISNCTVANTVLDLRFFKILSIDSPNPISGDLAGVFDDLKIWDGVDVADSFDARRYLQFLTKIEKPVGQSTATLLEFNLDGANNYALRRSANGAGDVLVPNTDGLAWNFNQVDPDFQELSFYNLLEEEKISIAHSVGRGTLGAGFAPNRLEDVFKWANTFTKISRANSKAIGGIDELFDTDTNMVVFGSDQ